ncbi:hypothetical protein PENSTE_c002G04335 [Penicillium steckii]|uniref:C2H2-type domain-containing protein n=1 Tax=Penicillium steckii TaxID=303698 RepID=A0A1V6TU68_9EURO|nr:hypothetical protein PENSTE_c002G04335 [Penicillium steckii]
MGTLSSTSSYHPVTRSDFDNPEVLYAINPHPEFGYFHGPIPDLNPGWKPQWYSDARASGTLNPSKSITSSDILYEIQFGNAPVNRMSQLAKACSTICDIIVGANGQMCGHVFSLRSSMRLHLRMKHTGAVFPPSPGKTSRLQFQAAENALKRWVLFGEWRRALYLNEPGRGIGLIEEYCDALEAIANEDPVFAIRFGTRFHRDVVHARRRNEVFELEYRPEMGLQQNYPDTHFHGSVTATPEAGGSWQANFINYSPIQDTSMNLVRSCPVTPVKARFPSKSPSKTSPRKRKVLDSPLKGQATKKIAPKSMFRLSDDAERYLASVLAGGPIDSWNMLDPCHAVDELDLQGVVDGD